MSLKMAWSESGLPRAVTFDATPGDTHLWTATVTEHPVEKGAPITDHVRAGAFRLSLDVIISNTPIDLPGPNDDSFTEGALRQLTVRDLGGGIKVATYDWSNGFDRVGKVYDALTNLIVNPPQDGITVMSSLSLYDLMEIVGISVPRSSAMGSKAIRFTLDLQQITVVESQTVATPAAKASPKAKGHKPTKEETDPQKASFWHNADPKASDRIVGVVGTGG